MNSILKTSDIFHEGMQVSELRENTSINFINSLRENKLIDITNSGVVRLTSRGKIASKLGVDNYLKMEKAEKDFLEEEMCNAKIENRGLLMIFGGMLISLLLIIGFWIVELKAI